jgi:hypothetical protein
MAMTKTLPDKAAVITALWPTNSMAPISTPLRLRISFD